MIATFLPKTLLNGALLAGLFFGAALIDSSSQAFASGGATGSTSRSFDLPSSPSREDRRIERLYNQGRKVFRRKVSCNDGCLVAGDIINNDNAAGFLLALHNQPRFKDALDQDEIQAVSVYMLRRYDIKVE